VLLKDSFERQKRCSHASLKSTALRTLGHTKITRACTNRDTGGSLRTSGSTFFTVRVTEHWHRLLREAVESSSLEILKSCLGMVLVK